MGRVVGYVVERMSGDGNGCMGWVISWRLEWMYGGEKYIWMREWMQGDINSRSGMLLRKCMKKAHEGRRRLGGKDRREKYKQ